MLYVMQIFISGEFTTQTCFQGRFGEETGSDEFGGCIIFHAPQPGQNLAIGRLEYVEVSCRINNVINASNAYLGLLEKYRYSLKALCLCEKQ